MEFPWEQCGKKGCFEHLWTTKLCHCRKWLDNQVSALYGYYASDAARRALRRHVLGSGSSVWRHVRTNSSWWLDLWHQMAESGNCSNIVHGAEVPMKRWKAFCKTIEAGKSATDLRPPCIKVMSLVLQVRSTKFCFSRLNILSGSNFVTAAWWIAENFVRLHPSGDVLGFGCQQLKTTVNWINCLPSFVGSPFPVSQISHVIELFVGVRCLPLAR